jgi:glycosyltransferase involved in cell wall biosynthesis
MRILHLPIAAGRQAWGLSRAERRLGHSSDVVVFEQMVFKLPADRILFDAHDGVFKRELKRWSFFLSSLSRYDVFHFHFGQKFFVLNPRPWKKGDRPKETVLRLVYWFYSLFVGRLDLIILKLLGKKMVMTFHGDDIRQGDRSKALYEFSIAAEVDETYYDDYSDERKRRMAQIYSKYCRQFFVVSPDLLDMAPQGTRLCRYTGVDPLDWQPIALSQSTPLIVHAPTHRRAKGTRFVVAAMENLKQKGYAFDFVLIENMSNQEARATYERADILIDQLLAGWYGVLATELLALGKTVISYIRPEDLKKMPKEFIQDFPVQSATPKDIESVVEEFLKNPSMIKKAGSKSRSFAESWHNPDQIASEIIAIYQSKNSSF